MRRASGRRRSGLILASLACIPVLGPVGCRTTHLPADSTPGSAETGRSDRSAAQEADPLALKALRIVGTAVFMAPPMLLITLTVDSLLSVVLLGSPNQPKLVFPATRAVLEDLFVGSQGATARPAVKRDDSGKPARPARRTS